MLLPSVPVLRVARTTLGALVVGGAALAQGPAFDSPGLSKPPRAGDGFTLSNDFNPAIGVVIDAFADGIATDGADDGFDAELRVLELNFSAHIDPEAWAYVVLASENGENPRLDEAAVEYTGMGGNQVLKVGRFFVDFGKQMQNHLEGLRTLERPLPLREFLGEELAGTGVQYDNWFAAGDATPVRFSIGAFASLLGEGHEHDDGGTPEPAGVVPDRKDIDELSFVARITAMTDAGERGLAQLGASVRHVPAFDFTFDDAGLAQRGLSNTVFGVDATWATSDATGLKRTLIGGEFLAIDGDIAGALDDPVTPTAIDVVDDSATGFFVFGDYAWDRYHSAGVQYAAADLTEDPSLDASELDLYYTHNLTEFRRLRFGVTVGEEGGVDSTRAYVQFTNYFGNHFHGLNW